MFEIGPCVTVIVTVAHQFRVVELAFFVPMTTFVMTRNVSMNFMFSSAGWSSLPEEFFNFFFDLSASDKWTGFFLGFPFFTNTEQRSTASPFIFTLNVNEALSSKLILAVFEANWDFPIRDKVRVKAVINAFFI